MSLIIYRSSAGSGKTFTLALHFLGIILDNPHEFRRILGLTFTNKAAAELKERILSLLELLSDNPSDPTKQEKRNQLFKALAEKGISVSPALAGHRAAEALTLILHQYSDFSVGTIDSFMHRVVSTFSFDMHLAHDCQVTLDQQKLAEDSVSQILSAAGTDEILTHILENILNDQVEDEKGWDLSKTLMANAKETFQEKSRQPLEDLAGVSSQKILEFARRQRNLVTQSRNEIKKTAHEAWNAIQAAGLDIDDFYYKGQGAGAFLKNMALAGPVKDRTEVNSRVRSSLENGNWLAASAGADKRTAFDTIRTIPEQALRRILELLPGFHLSATLADAVYPLALLHETAQCIADLKQKQKILHISDFNRLIRKVVLNEPVPYIYARLGVRYRYFLLDEFQDTSVAQWHNLIPLLAGSLAGNETQNTKNLIVGDGKQSIYRWRSGELEIFETLPSIYIKPEAQGFDDAERLFHHFAKTDNLPFNFRSVAEIVHFNNRFFEAFRETLSERGKKVFRDLHQSMPNGREGGLVQWEFLDKEQMSETPARVLNLVQQLHQQGYDWKDIAILVRRNTEGAQIAAALSEAGIQVASSDSLLLKNAAKVRGVIAWLYWIQNPADPVAYTQVLFALREKTGYSLPELTPVFLLQDQAERVLQLMNASLSQLASRPLYTLCEDLLTACGWMETPDAAVQFFLDKVNELSKRPGSSLESFLGEWETHGHEWAATAPARSDAVRILSIHKSKGLAFRVVIHPYLGGPIHASNKEWFTGKPGITDPLPWIQLPVKESLIPTVFGEETLRFKEKEQLDQANLLYVAFTRAEERLYVFAASPPAKKESESLIARISGVLTNTFGYLFDTPVFSFPVQPVHEIRKSGQAEPQVFIQAFPSGPWENKIRISRLSPDVWAATQPDHKRKEGKKVHSLLENLFSTLPDTPRESLLAGLPESMVKALESLAGSPYFEEIFHAKGEILTEKEILMPNGHVLRPDRILLNGDSAIVADYKTGGHHPSHSQQIQKYADAIRNLGIREVSGYLVYIHREPLIEKVC